MQTASPFTDSDDTSVHAVASLATDTDSNLDISFFLTLIVSHFCLTDTDDGLMFTDTTLV